VAPSFLFGKIIISEVDLVRSHYERILIGYIVEVGRSSESVRLSVHGENSGKIIYH